MKKIVFCFKNKWEIKNRLNLIKKLKKDAVVVSFNVNIESYLRSENISFKTCDEYIDNDIFRTLDKHADNLAKRWYLGYENSLRYQKVPLWDVVYHSTRTYFLIVLKSFEIVKKILTMENPEMVHTTKDLERFFSLLSSNKKIKVNSIECSSYGKLMNRVIIWRSGARTAVKDIMKKYSLNLYRLATLQFYDGEKKNLRILTWGCHRFFPVIDRLNKETGILVFERDFFGQLALQRKSVNYRCVNRPFNIFGVYKESLAFGKILNNIFQKKSFKNNLKYRGYVLWPVINQGFKRLCLKEIREAVSNIEIYSYIFKKEHPKLVLLQLDTIPKTKVIAILANMYDVPSIVIQHGMTSYKAGWVPVTSSKIAAWGEYSKSFLVKHGVPEKKVEITGYVMGNEDKERNTKKDICDALKLDSKKKIILFAGHTRGRVFAYNLGRRKVIMELFKAISELDNCQLIIKKHPAQTDRLPESLVTQLKPPRTRVVSAQKDIVKNVDIRDLIKASDLVITQFSTAALDAMMQGKPVITINFEYKEDLIPYASNGGAVGVYTPKELVPKIKDLLTNEKTRDKLRKNQKKFLRMCIGDRNRKAEEEIVKLIRKMIKIN